MAFAMSSLDTPTYHGFLDAVAPPSLDTPIVDVGGGDGRNAIPWLERGYRCVVVLDAAGEALVRLRANIAARRPEWLERILLIECDARALPLRDACAGTVVAIETLYYLNDDYEVGLRDCVRVLAPGGKLLVSERDREGALMMQLLYGGMSQMLRSYRDDVVWDGPERGHRTRAFSERELLDVLTANGLEVLSVAGTSLLSMALGWLNGRGLLAGAEGEAEEVRAMLAHLGRTGRLRRCHVVIAQPASAR